MGPHMQAADTADQKLADQRNGKHIVKKNQKQISLPPHPNVKGKPGNYVPSTDMFAKAKVVSKFLMFTPLSQQS